MDEIKLKPKGSGWFALGAGVIFLAAFICSFVWDLSKIPPYLLFKAWLLIAAVILLGWGIRRIKKGGDDWTVGQSTINFVVAILGATIAILAILLAPSPRP
jgi:hypothetical protein